MLGARGSGRRRSCFCGGASEELSAVQNIQVSLQRISPFGRDWGRVTTVAHGIIGVDGNSRSLVAVGTGVLLVTFLCL
jgi:hypothetical protein